MTTETIQTTKRLIREARTELTWTATDAANRSVDELDAACDAVGIDTDDFDGDDDPITIDLPEGVCLGILRQTRVMISRPSTR